MELPRYSLRAHLRNKLSHVQFSYLSIFLSPFRSAVMHFRRKIEFMVVAVFVLCGCFLLDAHFNGNQEGTRGASIVQVPWQQESIYAEGERTMEITHGGTKDRSSTLSTPQHTTTLTQDAAVPASSPLLPDRVVVMARTSKDDTRWVHEELQDWQSALYDIDIETPHNQSTLDPLTNNTLRTLRNKGREANAYLAYIVQHYDNLPSTIAFLHPHRDGYPGAWHTDNDEHSNVVSLRSLNTDFIQSNGYANLRCINDPGCPQEVMSFRNPPEAHRVAEAAMPSTWLALFNNTDVPQILATPCCAQFAVSSKQVRERSLNEYKKYYRWLMETPLPDDTSGRVLEYLWHVVFGQEPV